MCFYFFLEALIVTTIFRKFHVNSYLLRPNYPSTSLVTNINLSISKSFENTSSDDDNYRFLRRNLPIWLQYCFRDSGALRSLTDLSTLLLIKPVLDAYPSSALDDFLTLSGLTKKSTDKIQFHKYETISYGNDQRQILHTWQKFDDAESNENLILFVHGGFWGSGFPLMYRHVAGNFLHENYSVAILGYRTYPTVDVQGQIEDVISAVNLLRKKYTNITLVGHSTGAHIALMGILQYQKKMLVKQFIGLAGVYDIPNHYKVEKFRGIERISPLAKIGCIEKKSSILSGWKNYSPTRILKCYESLNTFPSVLLLHGKFDTTVISQSSIDLHKALEKSITRNNDVSLEILDVGHVGLALELMFGGKTQDVVNDWLSNKLKE